MTRIKAQGIKFEAVCEVYNRREESRFDIPFLPILYHDTDTGLVKPVGIPLDEPIDVKGSLVFVGFGITGTKGEDPPWDDYCALTLKSVGRGVLV